MRTIGRLGAAILGVAALTAGWSLKGAGADQGLSMQRGERIELRGFGVFQVKPRKRGIGRNPRTGKEVRIPPGRTIRFKPGKDLQNIS